ncbi:8893_t:CDS:2, partial [Ambispora leptoticha]
PKDLEELEMFMVEEWERIPDEILESLVNSAAVVRFALASNNTKAAAHFSVDKSLSRRVGAGGKELFPAEEEQLYAWVLQMREAALAIIYIVLRLKSSDRAGETAGGNLKRASLRTVCEWVLAAWDEISPEIIQRHFRSVDGSEDNEILLSSSIQKVVMKVMQK